MRGVNQIAATANNSLAAIRVVVAALFAPIVVVLKKRLRKLTVIKMSLMTILSLILNQQKQQ